MSDNKFAYGASAAFTIGLATGPLATSPTLVAGRQSTVIDNSSNLYLDYLIGGKITTGTGPSAGLIQIYAFGQVDDTPTYPDTLGASDAAVTFTSVDIRNGAAKLLASLITDTTANRTYWFGPVSLLSAYSIVGAGWQSIPKHFGIWVTQSTAVNLNATAGNHAISYTPVYRTIV